MANAVIVIDMVKGFMEEGHPLYAGATARKIIPCVKRLLERESALGSRILYLCDNHDEVDGKPIAKRGRIPGITPNHRLKRII